MMSLFGLVVYVSSHFVEDWVRIGSPAKAKVHKEHASVPFDDQCSILEKVRTPYVHALHECNELILLTKGTLYFSECFCRRP